MNFEEERNNLVNNIELLQNVRNLKGSKGWKIIEKHFNDIVQIINDKILIETDLSKISRLQERYRAFKSMLGIIDALCESQEEYQRQLHNLDVAVNDEDQNEI